MDSSTVIQRMTGMYMALYLLLSMSKCCPKRDIFLKYSMKTYRLCLTTPDTL